MTTPLDLAALRAMLAAATPGPPWQLHQPWPDEPEFVTFKWDAGPPVVNAHGHYRKADMELIVALVNAAPALLAEVARHRAAMQTLKGEALVEFWQLIDEIHAARVLHEPSAAGVRQATDPDARLRAIKAAVATGVQAEREACAALADNWPAECLTDPTGETNCGPGIAEAIRERAALRAGEGG